MFFSDRFVCKKWCHDSMAMGRHILERTGKWLSVVHNNICRNTAYFKLNKLKMFDEFLNNVCIILCRLC